MKILKIFTLTGSLGYIYKKRFATKSEFIKIEMNNELNVNFL